MKPDKYSCTHAQLDRAMDREANRLGPVRRTDMKPQHKIDIQRVHVTDADGELLYTRLLDDGSNVLAFDSGSGFIDRQQVAKNHWRIRPGWPLTRQHQAALEGRKWDWTSAVPATRSRHPSTPSTPSASDA